MSASVALSSGRPLRVLAIAGSLRAESLNRRALAVIAGLAPEDLSIEIHNGLDAIPLFNEDLEASRVPPAVTDLRAAIAAADGLLIATPEYNQSIPAVTKNFIDWLSRGDLPVLAGKPVAILGATVGPWGTRLAQAAVRQTLAACGAVVMPAPQIYLRDAGRRLNAQNVAVDTELRNQFVSFVGAFKRWMRLTGVA